eukprot:TRINITY_DN57240_c0_g1_i1.p1 TRINITY_DN57240_c0_g1~~TRINITY_DN57240_c0_g1_i1.p1  ORF type:complete len:163 (-),score=16.77 TRINITY_DN57240_c0_g1_i1:476-964(-)
MIRFGSLFGKHRFVCGILSSVGVHLVRYQGGDYIAQTQETDKLDIWRNFAFGTFGAYAGATFGIIYGSVYASVQKRGVPALALVLFDYSVTCQLFYFPQYYIVQEYVRSSTPSWERALQECGRNRVEDFKALVTVFLPFSWFNYSYVPPPWRGLFSGCAGLI